MTLFQNFVEPFNDLSQWRYFNSTTGASVDSHQMVFTYPQGVNLISIQATNEAFTLAGSWFSFRLVTPGPSQGSNTIDSFFDLINFDTFGVYQVEFLKDIDGGFVQIHDSGSDFSINYPVDTQPYFCVAADNSGNLTFYSSVDGSTWDTLTTVASALASETLSAAFYTQATGSWPTDYEIRYDNINLHSPFSSSLTQVYAAPLNVNWNVDGPGRGYMRASSRNAHQSAYDYLHGALAALGWMTAGSTPYGAPVVTMVDVIPDEWQEASVLKPGTVTVTLGNEPTVKGQELGNGLAKIDIPLFVDVFMDEDPVALALALDVRDIFCGRLANTSRYLPVTDYSFSSPQVNTDYWIEIEDVERVKVRNKWHSIHATLCMYFPDAEGN